MTGALIVCHTGDISCHPRPRWDAITRDILAGSLVQLRKIYDGQKPKAFINEGPELNTNLQ